MIYSIPEASDYPLDYDVREELDDIDRAIEAAGGTFVKFESEALDYLTLGADALLYVMAHRHTISVPTAALYAAEKVAVLSIARQDTNPLMLADVNAAIDRIAASVRMRDRLDREAAPIPATVPTIAPSTSNEGPMAKVQDRPIVRPPSGSKVEVQF